MVELIVIIFCFVLVTKRDFAFGLIDRILAILPEKIKKRGKNITGSFLDGLEIMKAARHFIKLTVLSFAIRFAAFLQVISMLIAFNVNMDMFTMVVAAVVIMVLNRFASTILSAPGSVGTFHAAANEGLVIFTVDPNTAIGFSILLHLSTYIPITLTGFYFFLRENIKISAAQKEYREETI